MKGKYYGVYDIRNDDACVGIFESIEEVCTFFGGIRRNRIECAICRNNPLTFGAKKYWVEVYDIPTTAGVRQAMRRRFGATNYKICKNGDIYVRENGTKDWQLFATDYEEVMDLCG